MLKLLDVVLAGLIASATPVLARCVDQVSTLSAAQVENFLVEPTSLVESTNEMGRLRDTITNLVITDPRRSLPELMKLLGALSEKQKRAIGLGLAAADLACMTTDRAAAALIRTTIRETHDRQLSRAFASVTDPDPSSSTAVNPPATSLARQVSNRNNTLGNIDDGKIADRKTTRVYSVGEGRLWDPLAPLPMRRPWESLDAHKK